MSLVRIFLVPTCLWSKFVAGPSVIFGPDLSSVRLWFSIRNCLRSESGFRSGLSFGPNLSFVRFCFWSELVGGLYLVFCTTLSLTWNCLFPNFSLVQIWFWIWICVRSQSCFRNEFVFSPIFSLLAISLVRIFFGSQPVFGPNLSQDQVWFSVRICLRSDFGFRTEFLFVPNLVFGPEFRLVRICLLCTFVSGPYLSVVFIWFSVRVFAPILSLVQI